MPDPQRPGAWYRALSHTTLQPEARGGYISAAVGVETREGWQIFSLMVIDADGASECCGESTPC